MAKIVGVVTTDEKSIGGGSPIFYTKNREDLQKVAHLLEKVMDCAAHEVSEDLFIIVDRH
ncbi:hypothetical protein [Cohnella sp.]|uniref:capping complex subunit for YIEGIA n=1 Tax=Cohnella sp. TaxID=1883426 RepID=UPI0035615E10